MFLEMNFKSNELQRQTQVNILIPNANEKNDGPYKTLWLLHGLSGNHIAFFEIVNFTIYAILQC